MSIDDELIERQRRLKTYRGAREKPIQVHRDGSIHRQAQLIIAISPVFDECDVSASDTGCS
jgi:hypothetical protein